MRKCALSRGKTSSSSSLSSLRVFTSFSLVFFFVFFASSCFDLSLMRATRERETDCGTDRERKFLLFPPHFSTRASPVYIYMCE
jgi:hypothetical protein